MGNWIASTVLSRGLTAGRSIRFDMLGVDDRFGESGKPWQLIKEFGLSAEHIAARAKKLMDTR
jgi:transketolase